MEKTVGPSGGQVVGPDNAITVNIPPGALPAETTITVTEIPPPAAGAIGPTFEIGPTGTQFAVPVTLTFSYAGFDLQGSDPSMLEVATIANGEWLGLANGAVDTTAQVVSGQTMHLSPYGIHAKGHGPPDDSEDSGTESGTDAGTDSETDSGIVDSSSDSSSSDSGSDGSSDAGADADASACIPRGYPSGNCMNHPLQLCTQGYVFTNCANVDGAAGFTFECCPP